ncbi:MAG: hypothetical protein QOI74_798, partial [Micromonosporaceae bacterium]|nr:hypothetical protein [Micromonosporaceae bacterium]
PAAGTLTVVALLAFAFFFAVRDAV